MPVTNVRPHFVENAIGIDIYVFNTMMIRNSHAENWMNMRAKGAAVSLKGVMLCESTNCFAAASVSGWIGAVASLRTLSLLNVLNMMKSSVLFNHMKILPQSRRSR